MFDVTPFGVVYSLVPFIKNRKKCQKKNKQKSRENHYLGKHFRHIPPTDAHSSISNRRWLCAKNVPTVEMYSVPIPKSSSKRSRDLEIK